MKRELLAATAALMICATSAFAGGYELQCSAPQTLVGEDANDPNPVTQIAVDYSWDDHAWRVFHQLRNGAVVSRQAQYGMADLSNNHKTQWQGRLLRQPWLFMIGEVKGNDRGEFTYNEWMYDSKRGNRLVMQAFARCTERAPQQQLPTPTAKVEPTQPYAQAPAQAPVPQAQTPAPTQQPPAPQVAARTKDSVPIIIGQYGVNVDVLLGGMPIRMMVDTGANSSQIPQSFASMLISNGNAVVHGTAPITYANGSKSTEQVLRVRELRIGSHVVRDVLVTISDGPPLIGFPVIDGIAPFTIDTRAGELVWHTTRG